MQTDVTDYERDLLTVVRYCGQYLALGERVIESLTYCAPAEWKLVLASGGMRITLSFGSRTPAHRTQLRRVAVEMRSALARMDTTEEPLRSRFDEAAS